MTRLEWNAPGTRRFETGVDRGVLYTLGGVVAPWIGLKSVNQKPQGASITTFYLDGEKFNQITETEEFSATLSAYSYPDAFEKCDGTAYLGKGLAVDSQPREMFHLSYRTRIGNDTDGVDHGYRIHLVYNALASPTDRNYESLGENATPIDFSWDITTMPIRMAGQAASAHYIVDSTRVNKYILEDFENILYGTPFTKPRMPNAAELTKFFREATVVKVTDNGDGTWTATGPDSVIRYLTGTEFEITWESAKFIDEFTYTLSTL